MAGRVEIYLYTVLKSLVNKTGFIQLFNMTVDSFPGLPPFPDDVPIVSLTHISFLKLQSGDVAEVDHLFQACKQWGFFFLDLRDNVQGSTLLDLADQVLEIGKNVFDLGLEEKNKYRMSKGSFDG